MKNDIARVNQIKKIADELYTENNVLREQIKKKDSLDGYSVQQLVWQIEKRSTEQADIIDRQAAEIERLKDRIHELEQKISFARNPDPGY